MTTRGQRDAPGRGRRRNRPDGAGMLRRPVSSYGDRSRRVIYVAAEGAKTERDYIALLNDTYGERDGSRFRLHFCHPGHDNGLRPEQVVDQVLAVAGPGDEKWAFFDRDAGDAREGEIPRAMHRAHRNGVQVALSHPSFELWLLLHFQQFTSQENGFSREVLKRLRGHKDAKGYEGYDQQSGDRGKGLGGQRGRALLDRERTAVRNARKLVSLCPYGECSARHADLTPIPAPRTEPYEDWTRRTGHAPGCDPLKRDPSSDVWRLLASVGIGTEGT
ncbi:RloB domain-containing protein [Streptomyces sp. ICN441]|uniref:RloB family protein n=1 Tax=Streptomyces sp. ICN441 TaxID=2558286 RepID=UPI001069B5CB|nr:RloB family protein [Streptomyces sp. ICN441]TFE58483.1 RloB domain-containing protein [Streptomyces sp. ICN441]